MQIVEIEHARTAGFDAANLIGRRPRAGVIPWSDEKEMFRAHLRGCIGQMIAIKSERAKFVTVVLASDGENRKRYFCELLPGRHHGLVVGVHHWVVNNPLKIHRWISNKTVERFERDVLAVSVQKFSTPKF